MSASYVTAKQKSELVRDETNEGRNTASRVGLALLEVLDAAFNEFGLYASKSFVSGEVNVERTRALEAEGELRTSITTETTRATRAEGELRTSIATEVTRATRAESTLHTALNSKAEVLNLKGTKGEAFLYTGQSIMMQGYPCHYRYIDDKKKELPFTDDNYEWYIAVCFNHEGTKGTMYTLYKEGAMISTPEGEFYEYERVATYTKNNVPNLILEAFGEDRASQKELNDLTEVVKSKAGILDISKVQSFWYKGQQILWGTLPCHIRYIYDKDGMIGTSGDYYIAVCYAHKGRKGNSYRLYYEGDMDSEGFYEYTLQATYTSDNVPEFILECFGENYVTSERFNNEIDQVNLAVENAMQVIASVANLLSDLEKRVEALEQR